MDELDGSVKKALWKKAGDKTIYTGAGGMYKNFFRRRVGRVSRETAGDASR
jgi:hypothetical protein